MESFLCEGVLRHRRFISPRRAFTVPLFMLSLDLAELDSVFAGHWLWSTRRPNLAWFRRSDHYGDPEIPLDVSIRDLVAARTGRRVDGPIRLLTHLRYLGYGFNPVSIYYCFGADGLTLEALVAEVANTPWNERHMYVLTEADTPTPITTVEHRFKKAFHVSPFLGMEMDYRWRFGRPPARDGERLWVNMENWDAGAKVFEATLTLTRKAITGPALALALSRHPAMTAEVITSIYGQAFRLWAKRAVFHPHPRTTTSRGS